MTSYFESCYIESSPLEGTRNYMIIVRIMGQKYDYADYTFLSENCISAVMTLINFRYDDWYAIDEV